MLDALCHLSRLKVWIYGVLSHTIPDPLNSSITGTGSRLVRLNIRCSALSYPVPATLSTQDMKTSREEDPIYCLGCMQAIDAGYWCRQAIDARMHKFVCVRLLTGAGWLPTCLQLFEWVVDINRCPCYICRHAVELLNCQLIDNRFAQCVWWACACGLHCKIWLARYFKIWPIYMAVCILVHAMSLMSLIQPNYLQYYAGAPGIDCTHARLPSICGEIITRNK